MRTQLQAGFNPLPYEDLYEQHSTEEAELTIEILEALADIQQKTYASEGHAIRSVHAKFRRKIYGKTDDLNEVK